VADGSGHAADLAVLAFSKFEAKPGIDDIFSISDRRITIGNWWGLLKGFGPAGEALVTFDDESAAAKFGESGVIGLSLHKDEVAAAVGVAGIEKAIFERFFVCEKKEPFGVHVESSEGKAPRREVEFLQSALPFVPGVGIKLAENTVGFVEGNEHRLARS